MPRPKGNGAGHGGPATGSGWGGPAKGAGKPAKPFTADSPTRVTVPLAEARAANGDKPSAYATRKAELEARADRYLDLMDEIAMDKEEPSKLRLEAMVHARNQILGTPTAKQQVEIKRPVEEMTEAELASAIELVRAALVGTSEVAGSGSEEASSGKPH